jgi:hypothetical protein
MRAALDELAPGAARAGTVEGRPWGTLTVTGAGTRRLPGMRIDRRTHEIRAATDGAWLQLTYRIDGALVDSATFTDAPSRGAAEARAFFAKHLPRVWWKSPPGKEGPPAPESPAGEPARAQVRKTRRSEERSAAPPRAKRHRKP